VHERDTTKVGQLGRRHFLVVALAGATAVACGDRRSGAVSPAAPLPAPPESSAAVPAPVAEPAAARSAPVDRLLIGYCGAPGSSAMGKMTGDLDAAGKALRRQIEGYRSDRPAVPVVELIATVVHRSSGSDGMYRSRAQERTVRQYLDQARSMGGLLLLNIQPGRADFLPEVQAYEHWLTEPDVGVALDPEWAVEEGVVPGKKFGRTTGAELDGVARYLGKLAVDKGIPDKVMIYHQVAESVVRDEDGLSPHPGVTVVKVVDGIGSAADKKATWARLMKQKPAHVQTGFKLFFTEDTRGGRPLMTPAEVLELQPTPSYVVYE
jgi:hypothetical protein